MNTVHAAALLANSATFADALLAAIADAPVYTHQRFGTNPAPICLLDFTPSDFDAVTDADRAEWVELSLELDIDAIADDALITDRDWDELYEAGRDDFRL